CRLRSASNSSTSRYDKEKRRYQPTARRMTSGSNCLHLNRPETDDARSIGPAYQTTPARLQHCQQRYENSHRRCVIAHVAPWAASYSPVCCRTGSYNVTGRPLCHEISVSL